MEVLGHAETGVMMNTYAHVLPALRQEGSRRPGRAVRSMT